MLAQRRRMCVALIAASDFAVVRLITGVNMRVLLPVRTVGEPAIAALEFALEWFFAYTTMSAPI